MKSFWKPTDNVSLNLHWAWAFRIFIIYPGATQGLTLEDCVLLRARGSIHPVDHVISATDEANAKKEQEHHQNITFVLSPLEVEVQT